MKATKCPKLIYWIAALGFISSLFGSNMSKAAAATSSKQLLTQADFTYIGAFDLPAVPNTSPDWGKGLAYRYVNGELHMFAGTWNPQDVYEVRVPTPSKTSIPVATLIRDWGDITHGKMTTKIPGGSVDLFGLYWDETDKRLYWSYQNTYNTGSGDPAMGYTVLSDSGSTTAYGPWAFTGHDAKAAGACVIPIPQWFADAYLGGKRLAAGCGGPWSAATAGPASFGPALTAFSPPGTSGSSISSTNLVGYPFVADAYGPPDRAHRDTNYQGSGDWLAWAPGNGIGYWTDVDIIWQGAAWIDLPDKHGVLFAPVLGNGRIWYESSTTHAASGSHAWFIYGPADFVKVAQGQNQEWEIQPTEYLVQYPGISYPLPGWSDWADNLITGVTFDSTANRLYIRGRFAGAHGTRVFVYQVQSSVTDTTLPSAPSNFRIR
jgi:hypothetical protein